MRTMLLTATLMLLPAGVAAEEETSAEEALPAAMESASPAPGLAGVWKLDAKASDSVDPLLQVLGRSSMERAMAKRVTNITQTVVLGDGWIEVTNANPYRSTTNRTVLGTTGTADIMGTSMEVTATVKDGSVVSSGTLELKDGPATFTGSRALGENGSMELRFSITKAAGGDPVVVRRVFRKQ